MRQFFIPLLALILALFSLIALSSVTPDLVGKQLFAFIVGGVIFVVISTQNLEIFIRYRYFFYIVEVISLALLLIFGSTTRGIVGWLSVGFGYKIQPAQFAIITTLLMLLTAQSAKKMPLPKFLYYLAIIFVPALLILLEPDIGITAIYLFSSMMLIWLLPINWRHIFFMLGLGLIGGGIMWLLVLKPYQKERLSSYFFAKQGLSEQDSGANYNAEQALIAVGSGEVFGLGLGQGVQSHLRFLPERQTDFIFASLAEEWGFIGSITVIIIYFLLILYIFRLGVKVAGVQDRAICLVVATMLLSQVFVNIGMNIGLVPITGITLPLLSYGGTSIVATLTMLGLVQQVALRHQDSLTLLVH